LVDPHGGGGEGGQGRQREVKEGSAEPVLQIALRAARVLKIETINRVRIFMRAYRRCAAIFKTNPITCHSLYLFTSVASRLIA